MSPKTPALDPMTVPTTSGSGYPAHLRAITEGRFKSRLTAVLGLTNFGVNLTTLEPGAGSALRHWHEAQDEFIYIVDGEATLVTDEGEQVLKAGMCAGFPKGKANGHCLLNKSSRPVTFLEIGDRSWPEVAHYPDDDLVAKPKSEGGKEIGFFRKDGTAY